MDDEVDGLSSILVYGYRMETVNSIYSLQFFLPEIKYIYLQNHYGLRSQGKSMWRSLLGLYTITHTSTSSVTEYSVCSRPTTATSMETKNSSHSSTSLEIAYLPSSSLISTRPSSRTNVILLSRHSCSPLLLSRPSVHTTTPPLREALPFRGPYSFII